MKTKTYLLIVLSLLLCASLAFSDTFRLGGDRITFHPSNIVTKTSAYTLTSSDSYVKVTCSSADIVITLPSISSVTAGGTKSYKILKTDATSYAVTVTPATGDTIGGESTRKLLTQNAYMVISTGPGNDWTVDFESDYIEGNYEDGTVTIGHARAQDCGTEATCDGTNITAKVKIVTGNVALAGGTATINSISPAFTSATSYNCVVSNTTTETATAPTVSIVSSSSFTITGFSTDTMNYICVGY